MSAKDDLGNTADRIKGKAKEGIGKMTDNERLEAEGKGDQVKADAKQAAEKAKDTFKDGTR
ncbi:CsbD family protein [Agromyces laixinhei]|uniref:CsbD family protein n=1 Tax=Agromyces laixinhei TaxID=2585717 RepID=UPI0012ECC3C1|nr:CsbD family protein [Agromyces laixinhei]